MKKKILLFSGIVLFVFSMVGIFSSLRAAVASVAYYNARYSKAAIMFDNPQASSSTCSYAYKWYPFNYYFCEWMACNAFDHRLKGGDGDVEEWLKVAQLWCHRGMNLNPWKRKLNLVRALLLAEKSPALGIMSWQEYVDWNFWDPYNHAIMVEMQSRSGDFDEAMESLKWVKGSAHYQSARQKFVEAWKKQAVGDSAD